MNLTISGHHLNVTPALSAYVRTKLDRITRHFDQVVDVTVLLTGCGKNGRGKGCNKKAEVTLHVKGRDIFAEHADEDMYVAIDKLMDKLDRQVLRHKSRLKDVKQSEAHGHCRSAGRQKMEVHPWLEESVLAAHGQ